VGSDPSSITEARDLYALPPEEFTAARDALAKRLRANKDAEGAAAVKKLRRPSAIAYTLNQVTRTSADLIDGVLAAGASLKDAVERGDGEAMREAEHAMRAASDAVISRAENVDTGGSLTADLKARMASTLRAAVLDPEVAERLRSGTLERDVEFAGFGLDDMSVAARPATSPRTTEADAAAQASKRQMAELAATAERLEKRARRLEAMADEAEQSAREARADADEARAEADKAAKARDAAAGNP
jgi:hypothetical protein